MGELDPTWARDALRAAQAELRQVEQQAAVLDMRRQSLEETVRSLKVVLITEAMNDESEEDVDPDVYRANMDRYMRNQLIHAGVQRIEPPKRKQQYSSSTIRVLRILAEAGPNPWHAGNIVTQYNNNGWDDDAAVITQAIRRNVKYGYVRQALVLAKTKVYEITDEGRKAIEQAAREPGDGDDA
jgi:hypothetical protein